MPIKCQSNQIFTEHYHYTMGEGENIFFTGKGQAKRSVSRSFNWRV